MARGEHRQASTADKESSGRKRREERGNAVWKTLSFYKLILQNGDRQEATWPSRENRAEDQGKRGGEGTTQLQVRKSDK